MTRYLVEVNELSFWHRHGAHQQQILNKVSLELRLGEVVALTGPSGSGKSTLLTIIGGLRSASHGSVKTLETEIVNSTERQRVGLRRRIGFIFQHHNLSPALTVAQNIQMGLQHSGAHKSKDAGARIVEAAKRVGIADHLDKHPTQLSGGQQQRAGIARALVNRPQLVLADEPTASLDKETGDAVLELFNELADSESAVVLVTHDKRVIEQADRILMLEDGRLVPPKDRILKDASSSMRTLMHLDSKRLGRMLSFAHALAEVALADGSVDELERDAMLKALETHAVFAGPEVELVVELALGQAKAWDEMSDPSSRAKLETALREIAAADDVVTEEERAVIDQLVAESNRR